ncbi:MAG: sulfatase-like hydrolase/transferase [Candidatus Hydrogenedens sp.]|nr:sulfatase-like hydrolase/transferase [Candidatus Hydrogenedens sp.]
MMRWLTAALLLATALGAWAEGPKNVVFILIDDMRFDAMSCMGHPFLETPNLDQLAAEGVMFDRAYVTTSLCSPSRASFLSSRYAHQHGVLDNGTLMDPALPTFPQELQRAGYETAFLGKWHMGGESDDPRPGFDQWVSFRGQGVYVNPQLNVNGEKVKRDGYITDLLTDYAEDFIKKDRDKPFMLYLSHKAVHAEFQPPERYQGSYADKTYPHPSSMADTEENYVGRPDWVRAQRDSWHGVDGMYNEKVDYDQFVKDYAETMRAVDDSVGRVMAALRETGAADNTLVVFTSDNGFLFGEHGLIDKRCMYEPSIRIPLIAWCAGVAEAGARRQALVTNLDFAPTFLEAAGVKVPEQFMGHSFWDALAAEPAEPRPAFLYEYFWERSFPQTPTVLGVHDGRYKLMQFHGIWDRYEMYDLENDPDEMHNLLADFVTTTEAGTLDNRIRGQRGKDENAAKFLELSDKLNQLLKETDCRPEPVWAVNP